LAIIAATDVGSDVTKLDFCVPFAFYKATAIIHGNVSSPMKT
jgi:hypothetical protein